MIGGLKHRLYRFAGDERGALLVFFAMCCATVFLIAALSFDLGKRASTQAELQSFADNVALAAAGELDGMPGALARGQTAANQLIRDRVTFAEGNRDLAGAEDFTISFFAELPNNEAAWNAQLDVTLPENDQIARFARVEVTPVEVEWSFARILTLFSSNPLPSDEVAAEATAGYSAVACDVTPVFFCMPPAESGVDTDGIWDPGNHIGEAIRLETTSGTASNWGPGSMGFIDVTGLIDTASPCRFFSGGDLYSCLSVVNNRRTQCIQNGTFALQDGEVPDVAFQVFNTRMDEFSWGVLPLRFSRDFATAPVVTKPFEEGSTCRGRPGGRPTDDATHFLPDDCLVSGSCTGVGNGVWVDTRMEYVDRNYSTDILTIGSVEPLERINVGGNEYHIDDPFRPGNATHPRRPQYVNYPVVPLGATRWNYYNAEVAAAYFEDPAAAYLGDTVDLSGVSSPLREDPIDLLEVFRTDGSLVPREGTSLPHCSRRTSLDPRRRAFIAAAVDCDTQPINGAATARASWFVELFILDVAEGDDDTGELSFHAEIITGGLQNAGQSLTNGTFRNFVQLYR